MFYSTILDIFFGALIAIASLWLVKGKNKRRETIGWGYGLVIAALVYLLFSIANRDWHWVFIEMAGVILYFLFFWIATKSNLYFIAIGWILHVLWDVILHIYLDPGYAPSWYPVFCIGFDIVIAGYLIRLIKNYKL